MQFVTSAAFLLTVYTDYLTAANQTLDCPDAPVQTAELLTLAQSQVPINGLILCQSSGLKVC